MMDHDLIRKKLAEVQTYVHELQTLVEHDRLHVDVKEERFAAHTLQLAIQSTLYVSSHIISEQRLGEPQTNQEVSVLLEQSGWVPSSLVRDLRNMAGFRNVLHAYDKFDITIMTDVLRNHLIDFIQFRDAIEAKLPDSGAR